MPDGAKYYAGEIEQRCGSMHARVWRRVCSFKQGGQCQKLFAEVIKDLYPFTEYSAWDAKWDLQLKAEIRSQKVGMWVTPPHSLLGSRPADVSHYFCCALWVGLFKTGLSHTSHKCHPSKFETRRGPCCHLEHTCRGSSK